MYFLMLFASNYSMCHWHHWEHSIKLFLLTFLPFCNLKCSYMPSISVLVMILHKKHYQCYKCLENLDLKVEYHADAEYENPLKIQKKACVGLAYCSYLFTQEHTSASLAGDLGSKHSGGWIGSPNAWMRGEEITSCKIHVALVSLTDWCIIIFKKVKKKKHMLAHIQLYKFLFVFNLLDL